MNEKWITHLINKRILKHTCGILIKSKVSKYQLQGSGILIKKNGKYFIVTASHVLEGIENIFVDTENGILEISGQIIRTNLLINKSHDVAFIIIDNKILPLLNSYYSFLEYNQIIEAHIVSEKFNYIIFGYPEKNRKKIDDFTTQFARYYLLESSKKKVYSYSDLSEEDFIIFDFKGKIKQDKGPKIKLFEPHGISGCGAWVVGKIIKDGKINIYYFLVGIMTEYRKGKYYILVANKMNKILGKINDH